MNHVMRLEELRSHLNIHHLLKKKLFRFVTTFFYVLARKSDAKYHANKLHGIRFTVVGGFIPLIVYINP